MMALNHQIGKPIGIIITTIGTEAQHAIGGSYSAGSRNGNEGYFYSDPRDTRNSIAVTVDFWYRLDDTETNDFRLYFYDGSNWDQIVALGSQPKGSWRHYSYTTTSSQYIRSNFRIRFYTNLGGGENVWVDDVQIIAVKTSDSILSEGFESWDDNWAATSTNWLLSPDQHHGGSYSAKSIDGQEGDLICNNLDTITAESITLDFWYRLDNGVDSGDFRVYFYDGSNWDQIVDLGNQGEDSWRQYIYSTSDGQYMKSNFRIRFDSNLGGSETIWIDDVTITIESEP